MKHQGWVEEPFTRVRRSVVLKPITSFVPRFVSILGHTFEVQLGEIQQVSEGEATAILQDGSTATVYASNLRRGSRRGAFCIADRWGKFGEVAEGASCLIVKKSGIQHWVLTADFKYPDYMPATPKKWHSRRMVAFISGRITYR